jgi:hypothetical protein
MEGVGGEWGRGEYSALTEDAEGRRKGRGAREEGARQCAIRVHQNLAAARRGRAREPTAHSPSEGP